MSKTEKSGGKSEERYFWGLPMELKKSNPQFPLKAVRYDSALNKAPYVTALDGEGYAKYLASIGVAQDRIADLQVFFTRAPKLSPLQQGRYVNLGGYNKEKNILLLYPGSFYKSYNDNLTLAKKITIPHLLTNLRVKFGDPFSHLTTKRLGRYLRTAPSERALAFADKLLQKAMEDEFNQTLQHESQHILDRDELIIHRQQEKTPFILREAKKISQAIGAITVVGMTTNDIDQHRFKFPHTMVNIITDTTNILGVGMSALGVGAVAAMGIMMLNHKHYRNDEYEKRARSRENARQSRENPMVYIRLKEQKRKTVS